MRILDGTKFEKSVNKFYPVKYPILRLIMSNGNALSLRAEVSSQAVSETTSETRSETDLRIERILAKHRRAPG